MVTSTRCLRQPPPTGRVAGIINLLVMFEIRRVHARHPTVIKRHDPVQGTDACAARRLAVLMEWLTSLMRFFGTEDVALLCHSNVARFQNET
jgi:hypothetical protein